MMKLNEYIENNGLKVKFICSKLGISRQTLYRINSGESVSLEMANLIWESLNKDIKIKVSDPEKGYIRNRSKKNKDESLSL